MVSKYVCEDRVIALCILSNISISITFLYNWSYFIVTAVIYYANKQLYDAIIL